MKVSIIIPCYNVEKHLYKCIESVLSQTYSDFELLLINDGSTDKTLKICEDFKLKDSRIKVFSHENRGVSYTRNRGIHEAFYDILTFIDSDDFIKIGYLEHLLESFDGSSNPICGTINIKKGVSIENSQYKELISKYKNNKESPTLIDLLNYESLSSPCARLYLKSVIIKNHILFREDLSYQEDLIFNLQYYRAFGAIKVLDYYGYNYVEHEASSSRRFHENFNYLDDLYFYLKSISKTEEDKLIVREFILQTCLRKLANIFHPISAKSTASKLLELKNMFESDYYKNSLHAIDLISINKVLGILLKRRSSYLIFLYFKILHRQ